MNSLFKTALIFALLLLLPLAACDDSSDDDDAGDDDQADDDALDDDAADDDDADDDAADDDLSDDDQANDDVVDDDVADDDAVDDDSADDDTAAEYVTPHVKDAQGREMILHGVNYMGLEYGGFNHTQEDYDRIAAWGFTHVRLPISWRYMETEPGVWDDAYLLETVQADLDMAEAAGIKVILDMHQWQWCAAFGGNGCPDWTCVGLYPDSYIGQMQFAADFWAGDLHEHWAQAWELTWEHLSDHPAVWGYDLFNEPWAGVYSILPAFDLEVLTPFYESLIATLRGYDEESWVLIEPQMTRDFYPTFLQPIDDEKVIYAPHNYTCFTGFGGVGYWCGKAWMKRDKRIIDRQRQKLVMPTVIGEFGITTNADGVEAYMHDTTTLHDRWALGEFVWVYNRDDTGWGLLYHNGDEKPFYLDYLIRPYPRAVAGHIESYGFDFDTGEFQLTYSNTEAAGDTLIFVPERHYPSGVNVSSTDPAGLWSYSYDEDAQVLSYTHDPASLQHTITIQPLASGE